jgi:transposase-like protein
MDATLKLKAEQLADEIASQARTLDDVNGLLNTLMKSALERILNTEMDVHLGRKTVASLPPAAEVAAGDPVATTNRRNGRSKKTLRGDRGELGRVSPHTMYVAIGVDLQGKKELLGLWLSETEGAKFWLGCLTD